jgi:hypothetical protein
LVPTLSAGRAKQDMYPLRYGLLGEHIELTKVKVLSYPAGAPDGGALLLKKLHDERIHAHSKLELCTHRQDSFCGFTLGGSPWF